MISKQPIPLGGGVNLFDDPIALPDGQWQRLRNLASRQTGVMGQRQSMSFVREVIPSWWRWDARTLFGSLGIAASVEDYWRWAENLRPLRFLFDPNFGEITMVAMTTASLLVSDDDSGVQTARTVPDGTMLLITLPGAITGNGAGNLPSLRCRVLGAATLSPSLFVFNGATYAFAGFNNGSRVAPSTTGGNVVDFSYYPNDFGTANSGFNPQGACVVRDRVVYFNGPFLYWSDRNAPLTVSPVGFPAVGTRDIFLGGEELEDITAVAELSTTADGSPVQSVAAAWTSTHMYMLLGEPLVTTAPGDILGSLQINRLNVQAGCVSQATVTRTPYGTFWAGKDDVWFMPFGNLPIRVGTSIRPLLEDQPKGLQWRMHAEYYNGYYRLSMFTPGQGPQMYDPCGMQMWLDLRNGPPNSAAAAQWCGPHVFAQTDAPAINGGEDFGASTGVWCMAKDTRGTGDGKLYALQRYVMGNAIALSTPDIKGMSLCGFDTQDGKDTCAPQAVRTPYYGAGQTYFVGDIHVPQANPNNILAPIYICTQEGAVVTEPNWLTPDAQGRVFDGANLIWHSVYFDGSSPMSARRVDLMQGYNSVAWSVLSKEFTLGDPTKEKLMDGAELGYWAQDRTRLTYNSHAKQDSQSRILGLTAEQTADNVTGQTTGDRVWQRKLLTPNPTKRFRGLSAVWECKQDAGIIITTGVNDTISGTVHATSFTATIPAGYYFEVSTLLAAVLTALTAAFPTSLFTSTIASDVGYKRGVIGIAEIGNLDLVVINTGSRLAQLLGYSPQQGATVTALAGNFVYGWDSPRVQLAPDMQLSAINLRFKIFNRGPT